MRSARFVTRGQLIACSTCVVTCVSVTRSGIDISQRYISPHLIFFSLVRAAAMEGSGRGHLSNVPGANPGCHQDLQVSVEYCMLSSSGPGLGQVTVM